MHLSRIGWDPSLESEFERYRALGLTPARVAREDRGRYLLLDETGENAGEVSGRFRREAAGAAAFPAVGDWVAVRPRPDERQRTIHALLPRRATFRRKVPGVRTHAQVLAANVDTTFLLTGLDGNFSLRRIERYLTLAHECGTAPVIVLSKADLSDDLDLRICQVEGLAPLTPMLATSAVNGRGIGALRRCLGSGKTGAFLGSSGVGKSTLINQLLGSQSLPTGNVRAADGRGRHTTTRRELLLLPNDGGVVIDTPGLREIQLIGDSEKALESFTDVQEAALACRFRDCRHQGEPGCGVQRALLEGQLDVDRFESFLEQRRELAYQARRRDQCARKVERARWRRITMDQRKRRNDHGRAR